jgi:transposase
MKNKVGAITMESAGVYWKPIFNILEDCLDIVLENPQYLKKVPGKRSDVKRLPVDLPLCCATV